MSPQPSPLPVTVIGGYLGAGKTTLLNRVLASPECGRVAVLVNDFGDINVDAASLARSSGDAEVIELSNGCICCSLADGFRTAMATVAERSASLDQVLIEVSGVGDPLTAANWARTPGFGLSSVLVLIDETTIEARLADPWLTDTIERQIAGADLLVVRGDPDANDQHTPARQRAAALRPDAPMLSPDEALRLCLAGIAPDSNSTRNVAQSATPSIEAAHAAHVAASITDPGSVGRDALGAWLDAAPAHVLRAKGVISLDDGTQVEIQLSGARAEWSPLRAPGDAPGDPSPRDQLGPDHDPEPQGRREQQEQRKASRRSDGIVAIGRADPAPWLATLIGSEHRS